MLAQEVVPKKEGLYTSKNGLYASGFLRQSRRSAVKPPVSKATGFIIVK
jgi:hypothetical protein